MQGLGVFVLSRHEIGAKQAKVLKELRQEKSWKSPVFMQVTRILLKYPELATRPG
jgi:hypothetical protein